MEIIFTLILLIGLSFNNHYFESRKQKLPEENLTSSSDIQKAENKEAGSEINSEDSVFSESMENISVNGKSVSITIRTKSENDKRNEGNKG